MAASGSRNTAGTPRTGRGKDWAVEELSWYPLGYHAGGRYPTEAAAMAAARVAAPWLVDAMEDVMENHGPSDTA